MARIVGKKNRAEPTRLHIAPTGLPASAFLTNYGLVLLSIAEDPQLRMREIAAHTDITERAAQRIVANLIESGYLIRTREGRRNSYTVRTDLPVALAAQRNIDLGSLLEVLLPPGSSPERCEAMAAEAEV